MKIAAVAVLATAGFAVASIASGSSTLSSSTETATTTTALTVTATTTTATTSTVTVTAPAKVTVCHRTGSRKHPFVTITVSPSALPALVIRHHDLPGACTSAKVKLILKSIKSAHARARHHR